MNSGRYQRMLTFLGLIAVFSFLGCAPSKEREATPAAIARVESLKGMGDAHLREGRFRAAMQSYIEADSLDARNPELKFRIGLVYADYFKKPEEAIPYYQEAIRLKKDYSEAYNNLGIVYSRQQRWDDAIEMFKRAIGNLYYPTPEFAYFNLGLAHTGKRDFNKAIEAFQMAIDLKGQYVDPYVELGLVYQEQGNHPQAVQIFQQARALMEKKEPKKGKTSEAEWNAYRSKLAEVCYYQALSLTKLSRFSDAAESYQKALDAAPDEDMQRRIQRELESLPSR